MTTRVALIGVSGFGDVHYRDVLRESEAGHFLPVAATIIDAGQVPQKVARLEELGCAIYDDYRAMLRAHEGAIDLCCIPTGIHWHAPMTCDALAAGCNVFVEKPAAPTVQEVARMREAERASPGWCAVGYNLMYSPLTQRIKQLVLDGCIGRVRAVTAWGLWGRPPSYYERNGWAGRLKLGEQWVLDSPFNNALAHHLNLIAFFAGREFGRSAAIASVQAELYRGKPIESCDTACIRAMTEDDIELYFVASHSCAQHDGPEVVLHGDAGRIVMWHDGTGRIERADGTGVAIDGGDPARRGREAVTAALRDKLADPEAFVCDLGIAGTQTLIANAANDSSRIHPVPAELVSWQPFRDDRVLAIAGIDALVRRAVAERKLFSELGDVSWAVPGEPVSCRDYRYFPGGAMPVAAG